MSNQLLQIGDKVFYTGKKFSSKLNGKTGWIHARVQNQEDHFVVEFPDTKNLKEDPHDSDDYILHRSMISTWRPPPGEKKQEGPEVQPRRGRQQEEE